MSIPEEWDSYLEAHYEEQWLDDYEPDPEVYDEDYYDYAADRAAHMGHPDLDTY